MEKIEIKSPSPRPEQNSILRHLIFSSITIRKKTEGVEWLRWRIPSENQGWEPSCRRCPATSCWCNPERPKSAPFFSLRLWNWQFWSRKQKLVNAVGRSRIANAERERERGGWTESLRSAATEERSCRLFKMIAKTHRLVHTSPLKLELTFFRFPSFPLCFLLISSFSFFPFIFLSLAMYDFVVFSVFSKRWLCSSMLEKF